MSNYMGRVETENAGIAYKVAVNFPETSTCTQVKSQMKRSFKQDTSAKVAIIFDNAGKVVFYQKRVNGEIVTIEEQRRQNR